MGSFFFFFFSLPRHMARGVLVPRPGIEPVLTTGLPGKSRYMGSLVIIISLLLGPSASLPTVGPSLQLPNSCLPRHCTSWPFACRCLLTLGGSYPGYPPLAWEPQSRSGCQLPPNLDYSNPDVKSLTLTLPPEFQMEK